MIPLFYTLSSEPSLLVRTIALNNSERLFVTLPLIYDSFRTTCRLLYDSGRNWILESLFSVHKFIAAEAAGGLMHRGLLIRLEGPVKLNENHVLTDWLERERFRRYLRPFSFVCIKPKGQYLRYFMKIVSYKNMKRWILNLVRLNRSIFVYILQVERSSSFLQPGIPNSTENMILWYKSCSL